MIKPEQSSVKPLSEDGLAKLRRLRLVVVAKRVGQPADIEREAEELISDFDGDARAALCAVLADFNTIVADYEATISSGFVRRVKPTV